MFFSDIEFDGPGTWQLNYTSDFGFGSIGLQMGSIEIKNGTLIADTGTLLMIGGWTEGANGDFNANGGNVIVVDWDGEAENISMDDSSFYNLIIGYHDGDDPMGGNVIFDSDIKIDGDLFIYYGDLYAGDGNTVAVAGNWQYSSIFTPLFGVAEGEFHAGTSAVVLDGAGAQSIYSDNTFYDVTISNSSVEGVTLLSGEHMTVTNSFSMEESAKFTLAENAQLLVTGATLDIDPTPIYSAVSAIIHHNGTTYDYYGGSTGINKDTLIEDFTGTDNVTIKAGVLPQNEAAEALSLTIDSGATYTVTTGNLDVGGTIDIDGTLNGANIIYLTGNWDNDGVFASGTGSVVFDGAGAQTIYSGGITDDYDFYDVTISNTGTGITLSSEQMKVLNSFSMSESAKFTLAENAQLLVTGATLDIDPTPTYNAVSAIIHHNGTTYDYYGGSTGINKDTLIGDFTGTDNVTIKEGTLTQNEAAEALSLTVDSGATYMVTTGNLDVGGTIDIDGTLNGANIIYLTGNWDNDGVFDSGTGAVVFDGAGAQTIYSGGITADDDFYDVTISNSGTGVTLSSEQMKVTNSFSMSESAKFTLAENAQLLVTGATLDIDPTPIYNAISAIIHHNGTTYDYYAGSTGINKDTLIEDFTGTDNVTIKEGILTQNEAAEALSLTVDSGATYTVTTGDIDVGGAITNAGTIDLSGTASNINVAGAVDFTGGTFTKGTGIFTFDGGASQNFNSNDQDMGNVATSVADTIVVLTSGLNADDVTIGASTTLDDAANNAITVAGDWDNNGTFISGTSLVTFDGTTAQAINTGGTGAAQDFCNVTIANTDAAVTVSSENLKLTGGALIVNASALLTLAEDAQVWVEGGTVTLTNTPTYNAVSAIINHNGTTYDYYGGATGIDKDTLLYDFELTDNVTIKAGTLTQNEAAAALSLTIDSGATYTVTTGNLDVGGTIDIDGTLNGANIIYLTGNWENDGVFTSGTSTVVFDGAGDSGIYGDTTFYNLSCITEGKTLNFEAGTTQTITGPGTSLTLRGQPSNQIVLRSLTDGMQWNIDPQGGYSVTGVDVKDSNNINASNVIVVVTPDSTNRGNNINWFFEEIPPVKPIVVPYVPDVGPAEDPGIELPVKQHKGRKVDCRDDWWEDWLRDWWEVWKNMMHESMMQTM